MPLVATVTDGNTSDTACARDHLKRLPELLADEREVTVVGDCKLVDGRTVGRILHHGPHVVSLLPKTFNARQELLEASVRCRVRPWQVTAVGLDPAASPGRPGQGLELFGIDETAFSPAARKTPARASPTPGM